MVKKILLVIVCLLTVNLANPVIVLNQNIQSPITDMHELQNYLSKNTQINSYFVEGFKGSFEQLITFIRNLLKQAQLNKDNVSSFISDHHSLKQNLQQFHRITIETVAKLLETKNNAVFVFEQQHKSVQPRILQNTTQTGSKLFENMTPITLSGLLVTLFLIIVLLIGVSCLYNIKTNDKFCRSNLWVGKQS